MLAKVGPVLSEPWSQIMRACELKSMLIETVLIEGFIIIILLLLLLLLLLKKIGSARLRESDVHPISLKTPAPQCQPIDRKRRKGKRVEDYSRDRAAQANEEALALLLKPASPTLSNTGFARSFQRDTEKGIKVLLFCKVLQRGSAYVYQCATGALHVTRTGTYGPDRAPLRGCTRLHLIL